MGTFLKNIHCLGPCHLSLDFSLPHLSKTNDNAQDFKANKDMCEVFMKTVDGGDCTVSVECQEGGKREYYDDKQWEDCRVQGREFFDDPRIGKFRYGKHNSIPPLWLLFLFLFFFFFNSQKLGSFGSFSER